MYICRNCGQRFAEYTNFCATCGSSMVEPENAQEPIYSYYPPTPAPTSSKAGLGQAIASMILGIEGIFGALIALLYAFFIIVMAGTFSYSYYDSSAYYGVNFLFGFTVGLAFIELIIGIVSIVLGCSARNKGSKSGMAGAGKVLGIFTIIISVISIFVAFAVIANI